MSGHTVESDALLWHWLTCWARSRWRLRRFHQPLWRNDKTAQMLGVAEYGCPRCGRGSIAERDARTVCRCGHGVELHDHEADPALCMVCGDADRCVFPPGEGRTS